MKRKINMRENIQVMFQMFDVTPNECGQPYSALSRMNAGLGSITNLKEVLNIETVYNYNSTSSVKSLRVWYTVKKE